MKGTGGTLTGEVQEKATSSQELEHPVRRAMPREYIRAFFSRLLAKDDSEKEEVVCTLPPIFPIESGEKKENSGFIAFERAEV